MAKIYQQKRITETHDFIISVNSESKTNFNKAFWENNFILKNNGGNLVK